MDGRTRKNSQQRRQEITDAVFRLIGERGITFLTTSTLAEEVGLTTGGLFRHFDSWEHIYRHVVNHAAARMETTFPDAALPAKERLFLLAKNRIQLFSENPGLAWLFRSKQSYLVLPEECGEQLQNMVKRSKAFLLQAIEEGRTDGSIRRDLEPAAVLVLVTGVIQSSFGAPGPQGHNGGGENSAVQGALEALSFLLAPPQVQNVFPIPPEEEGR